MSVCKQTLFLSIKHAFLFHLQSPLSIFSPLPSQQTRGATSHDQLRWASGRPSQGLPVEMRKENTSWTSRKNTLLRVIPTMTFIFCYWQIFWHSIWHIFWHSIWHSIWHLFWHSNWHIFSHGISSGILSGISSGILSDILSGILSGLSSGILSGISFGILSGISSGILSGRWAPAAHTELGRSQVEVQRCTPRWDGPRLRSSGAHWAGKVPGWGPAVHTELGRSQVEVQRCTLSWEVGKELGQELARRELRWKLMQTWSRRNRRRRRRRRRTRRRKRRRRRMASRGGGGRGEEQLW